MERAWGKNVVIVAALLGAGFFAAWLRFRPHLGHAATWTDGEVTYSTTAAEGVRHAIWELPQALPGGVNTPAREGRPAVSPNGRWLVFAVGRPGLDADLWIAELSGGEARDPRPLSGLNGPGDECAPAFGHGELYFASDRAGGAGGLDLWRADFDDGRVGTPIALGLAINGRFDDTDPAPRPGGELAFSSNRGADSNVGESSGYDLYLASPRETNSTSSAALARPGSSTEARWDVAALETLNGKGEEREPAFDATGRSLVFARDAGAERGFELVRSILDRGTWLPAEPIAALNTSAHERGPVLSSDGFALFYARENRQGDSDLWTARSRELFRVPSRPVGWVELLVLAALVLLALLAWLAKRWETIDVLYRCVLASLIVHLLLLWWFRDLYPEREEFALARGSERTFRVELASLAQARAAAQRANSERSGFFERGRTSATATGPERAMAAPAPAAAFEPTAAAYELTRLEAQGPDAPRRAESKPTRSETTARASVALNGSESFERLQERGPAIETDGSDHRSRAGRQAFGARANERGPRRAGRAAHAAHDDHARLRAALGTARGLAGLQHRCRASAVRL